MNTLLNYPGAKRGMAEQNVRNFETPGLFGGIV